MKQLLLTGVLICLNLLFVQAQTPNTNEVAKLKAFLEQESSEVGKKNYEQLAIADLETVDWLTVTGLSWNEEGLLESMHWAEKKLSGDLNLSDFVGLKKLHCEHNTLQTVNVTGCTTLNYMDCFNNEFKTIDLTTNSNLDSFCCRYNQLKEVDLTQNTKLIYFCGSGNQFEYFDLSNNPELTTFYCANNKLKSIDFSNNPKLTRTYLRTNQLTTLDFSKNKKLEYVTCYENKLETLNLSGCEALEYITCRDNRLTEIDASQCPKLTVLPCQNNRLKTIKLGAKMETVFCEENQLTFSTLPLLNLTGNDYTYSPQASQVVSFPADKVDLTTEYLIDGIASTFTWTNKSGTSVTPTKNENGLFGFDKSYVGNTLTCKIENSRFPELTMEYNVTLSTPVANDLLESAVSIYTNGGSLYLKTDKAMTAKIYSITGALIQEVALQNGEKQLSLSRGLYIVSLSNGMIRKVIIR